MKTSYGLRAAIGAGAILILGMAACGGGGGASPMPIALTTNAPSSGASSSPTQAPSNSPTVAPTIAPTQAPQSYHVAGAPATIVTTSGLVRGMGPVIDASGRRGAQSVNLGSGGAPTVVVAYNPTMGATFSQLYTWAANASATPVPEATMAATTTGPMTITAASPDTVNSFSTTYFDWIVNPGALTGTGKIAVNVVFPNASGPIFYYSYDKSNLDCGGVSTPSTPTQWGYQGGVPVGNLGPDVSVTCTTPQSLNFPNGAKLLDAPLADAWGNLASQMTTVTAMGTFTNSVSSVLLSALQNGAIYIVKLGDGGYAKLMVVQNPTPYASASLILFSLHDSPSGSGSFPF